MVIFSFLIIPLHSSLFERRFELVERLTERHLRLAGAVLAPQISRLFGSNHVNIVTFLFALAEMRDIPCKATSGGA